MYTPGPSAVSLDFTFVGSQHVYGLPEHSADFSLKSTYKGDRYPQQPVLIPSHKWAGEEGPKLWREFIEAKGAFEGQPYRLYNLDVAEYPVNSSMSLYGSIPLLISHNEIGTAGVLWMNAAESWVHIGDSEVGKDSHFISESGVMDFYLLSGPSPRAILKQYADVTGYPAFPPEYSLGYHQSRWSYENHEDVLAVDAAFDKNNIPYDVLWLDIDHTDGRRYLTWNSTRFPNPAQMQHVLADKKRKMVAIIDPHISIHENYHVHQQASSQGMYVRAPTNEHDFEGVCWPGVSAYIDFLLPEARAWWGTLFALDQYNGSTPHLMIWNDMNEPSVFDGPEITMPKDALHENGKWEHRDVHNLYGSLVHEATYEGLLARSKGKERPFTLARSFFAGSQRFGAVWTGDNSASWEHLRSTTPMLLSMSTSGLPFVGADVGGFHGHPSEELIVRWYQMASFQPFFRGHSHTDSPRREPWTFSTETMGLIKDAIRRRYTYLPYWYTLFYEATRTGMPPMRALWHEFPRYVEGFSEQNCFLVGSALLVAPVLTNGTDQLGIAMPPQEGGVWYRDVSYQSYLAGENLTVPASLSGGTPVFIRGGSIVPKRERHRQSAAMMSSDPITLVLALAIDGSATGELFMDDGVSFEYSNGHKISTSPSSKTSTHMLSLFAP